MRTIYICAPHYNIIKNYVAAPVQCIKPHHITSVFSTYVYKGTNIDITCRVTTVSPSRRTGGASFINKGRKTSTVNCLRD